MGYSVVTTVLSPAASYALTDLATVKDELSIQTGDSTNDAWLGRAITQTSASISNYCRRVFAPERVQDVFDIQQDPYPYQTPGGFAALELSRLPVLAVLSVVQTLAVGVTQTLVEGVDFRTDPNTGRLLRLNPFTGPVTTWEAVPVTVTYTAGHGALVQEAHTVPTSPYQVTVAQSAAFSCDQSVAYASGVALTLVTGSPAQGQYSVAGGVYTFNPADVGPPLSFTYAVLAVPADLVDATLRLVTSRFQGKDRDPLLMSMSQPNLGEKRYWVGTSPGQNGAFGPEIEGLLSPYRAVVVA